MPMQYRFCKHSNIALQRGLETYGKAVRPMAKRHSFAVLKGDIRAKACNFSLALMLSCSSCIAPAIAQGMFIYPSRGQSQDQQGRDKYECSQWATQQTGFNPSAPQPAPSYGVPPPPAQQAPQGGVLPGAARGAAIGAVGGAIGGNAGKGAAIGAATGAMFGGFRRAEQARMQQSQQQAYQQQVAAAQAQQSATVAAQRDQYNRAMGTCLQARGYTVG